MSASISRQQPKTLPQGSFLLLTAPQRVGQAERRQRHVVRNRGAHCRASAAVHRCRRPIPTATQVSYRTRTAACRRACRSGPFPACWVGRCTALEARPSRSCSGTVFWHKAHQGPSRGPHPFLGGSAAFQCSSSGRCPPGRGRGPGPGYWHHRCGHERYGSLQGWTWSALSPGSLGSTDRCGAGSLQTQRRQGQHKASREGWTPTRMPCYSEQAQLVGHKMLHKS